MTKMAACYPNYELPIFQGFTAAASTISQPPQPQQQQNRQVPTALKKTHETHHQQLQQKDQSSYLSSVAGSSSVAVVTEAVASVNNLIAAAKNYINTPKNYFVPLHVDCSVEYELPKQPKPPAGQRVEPLLMIHPCYFRKMESQRRSPFINNMPNSSRNGAAMFVGVALVSKGSNIAPASSSTLSLKGTLVRNHHHHNTKQNLSSQFGAISATHQQQQFQQHHTPQQHKSQNNLSVMQRHYPEGSSKFLEHSLTPIRRAAIALVNRTNPHVCSTQQRINQRNHLVQNATKSATGQWDQPAALKFSIGDQNSNKSSASINYICGAAECSIPASSTLGKRDAMISGSYGYSTNSALSSKNIMRIQMNKNGSNNASSSSEKNQNTKIVPNICNYGISTCLADKTKLFWNRKINTIPSFFMIDQSPNATVPSNFQAGPDTVPTTPLQNKYRTVDDNNKERINKNNIVNSGKFRHYLKSHRVHPFLTGTSHSDSTAAALSSKSALVGREDFQVLPQNSASKSAIAAVSTANSFQNVQQISCYNV